MRGGTLFSGIGAPECAGPGIDWRWAAEIDPFAAAVYRTHFPGVPNLGDVTTVDWRGVEDVDLLTFGSPCQSFSVAGQRRGLDDPRGHLALVALGVVDRLRPRWFLWENVAGALSSNGGRDFATFIRTVGNIGYGYAFRLLDAQYFGVPQRRRRLFLVGYSGDDWRPPAAVLFDSESLRGCPAPRRQTPEAPAGTAAGGARSRGGTSLDDGPLIAFGGNNTSGPIQVATAVNAHGGPHGRLDFESETFIVHALRGEGFDGSEDGTGRGTPLIPVMAFSGKNDGADARLDLATTLRAMPHAGSHANAGGQVAVTAGTGVRRLTPRECGRLMGFPDDWTAIDWRGRPAPDGRQYKTLGNSMAVPVLRWLLDRLIQVDSLLETGGRALSPPGSPLLLPPETPLRGPS